LLTGMFFRTDKVDQESMASGSASNAETLAGNTSSQHKWASWLEADKQTKETSGRDGSSEFVSTEPKRPGSAKLWPHPGIAPHSIKFFCGNPSVEKTEGIIHLYREE